MKRSELRQIIKEEVKKVIGKYPDNIDHIIDTMGGLIAMLLSNGKAFVDEVGLKVPDSYRKDLRDVVDSTAEYYKVDSESIIEFLKTSEGTKKAVTSALSQAYTVLKANNYYYDTHDLTHDVIKLKENIKIKLPKLIQELK